MRPPLPGSVGRWSSCAQICMVLRKSYSYLSAYLWLFSIVILADSLYPEFFSRPNDDINHKYARYHKI